MSFVRSLDSSLVLETPDPAIEDEFRFAKIRATESIYRTKDVYKRQTRSSALAAKKRPKAARFSKQTLKNT